MIDPQASRFWHAATRAGLAEPERLRACWDAIPPEKRTIDAIDRRLARQAVSAGVMTLWQAQQVLAGRGTVLKIDKYLLLDLLGQGGMGRVFLARDSRLGRLVALKVLSRERMGNPRALARFQREVRLGAQLQHEHLVRIYDAGEAQGITYLVMEYIQGKTVAQLVADHGRLAPPIAASVARQVALGLEHLHQKGLLHRDVNPMNVLIDAQGLVKLTDLGLAIDLGDQADNVTREGATVGTFDYISPEQARHSRSVDIRSDIYSLGCSLFHMIAGRVPFPSSSLPEKLYAHQTSDPEPLTELVPGVPEALDAIVRRMMRKDPADRFERPIEVARALEPFASGLVPLDRIGEAPDVAPAPGPAPAPEVAPPALNGAVPRSSSDPELTPTKSHVPPAGTATPDPFPQIDLGPQAVRLSDSRTTTGSTWTPDWRWTSDRRVWLGLGLAALAVALAALAWWAQAAWGTPPSDGADPITRARAPVPTPPTAARTRADIEVHYLDADSADPDESPPRDLHEAIQRVVGKRAEVVLRNAQPIAIKAAQPLRIAGGSVTIRAAEGARPLLAVEIPPGGTFLQVAPDAHLTLARLTLVATASPAGPSPPTLIDASGRLTLDRCALSTTHGPARAVAAEGARTDLLGCWFEGFDVPVALGLFPGTEARLVHCLIDRTGGDPATSWAVSAALRDSRAAKKTRLLVLDHCTVAGAGLIRVEGFSAAEALDVQVRSSAVRGQAVAQWSGPADAFPAALHWAGRANRYQVGGVPWVVQPNGLDGLPGGPTDLASFAKGPIAEADSQAAPIRFADAGGDLAGREPSDFVVLDASPPVGAEPRRIGPGAREKP